MSGKRFFMNGCGLLLAAIFTSTVYGQHPAEKESAAFKAGLTYTGELFGNLWGGLDTGVRYQDNFDADLTINLESLVGLKNSKLFFYGLGNQGGRISELTGDVQGVSNIEAENSWRLYEAWFEKTFTKANTSLLLGLYDLNSEFDVIQTATLFINSSHGIGAAYGNSGVLGPSVFPYTSLGARIKINPARGLTFKGTVLDGVPSDPGDTRGTDIYLRESDGALVAAEVNYSLNPGSIEPANTHAFLAGRVESPGKFRFGFGGWIYTKPRLGWLDDNQRDQGVYAFAESRLYSEAGTALQGLAGFVRFGLANGKINRFSGYAGAGLVYTGPFNNRDEDLLGLAVAVPLSSPDYQAFIEGRGLDPSETEATIEATYFFAWSSFVSLQMDAQYVINPNTIQSIDNAFVAGTRLILSL